MATILSPDTVTSSVLPAFTEELRDNFFVSHTAFDWLIQDVEVIEGGLYIADQILYNLNPNADVWGGGVSTLPLSFVQNTTQATFNPIYYAGSVTIPDTIMILDQGDRAIIDLVSAQFEHMLMSFIDKMSTDLYSDGTPRNGLPILQGLNAACTYSADPGMGPYGGITRVGSSGTNAAPVGPAPFWNAAVLTINGGSQPTWIGNVNPGTSTTMSVGAMIAARIAGSVGQFESDLVLTDNIGYQAYLNLVTQTVRQSASTEVMSQGAKGIEFAGVRVVKDDKCPSGTMYFLNDLFRLCIWRNGAFVMSPWRQTVDALVNTMFVIFVGACRTTRPNTLVKMSGITG